MAPCCFTSMRGTGKFNLYFYNCITAKQAIQIIADFFQGMTQDSVFLFLFLGPNAANNH